MATVRNLLQIKGNQVWSIGQDQPLLAALQLLAQKNIGALPVCDGPMVVGILSERDTVRRLAAEGQVDLETPVRQFMTSPVITVSPEDTLEGCMRLMTDLHIRHLPVLDQGRLGGMISIGDVVKAILSDRDFTIQHLENYITGKK